MNKFSNMVIPVLALVISGVSFYFSTFYSSNKAKIVIDSTSSNPLGHSYYASFFIINSGNTDLLINSTMIIVPSVSKLSNPIENPCMDGEVAVNRNPMIIKPGEIKPVVLEGDYDLGCYWEHTPQVSVSSDTLVLFEEAAMPEQALKKIKDCKKINLSLSISGAYGTGKVFDQQITLSELYFYDSPGMSEPVRLHENWRPRGSNFDL